MEGANKNLNKFKNKSFATVEVHGLCRCGVYYEASLVVGPLTFESPNKALEMPHTHYTIRCWKCGRLVNLVSITKEPLKKEV